jgi:hypothetical protein
VASAGRAFAALGRCAHDARAESATQVSKEVLDVTRFRIATVDGKEIHFQHDTADPEQLIRQALSDGAIWGSEITNHLGEDELTPIAILASSIVAIRMLTP